MRDKTFGEDLQRVRTGNQPNAHAAIRNLVTGAFRRAGFANIAHARRYYGRDEQRILSLYGYTKTDVKNTGHITQTRRGPVIPPARFQAAGYALTRMIA